MAQLKFGPIKTVQIKVKSNLSYACTYILNVWPPANAETTDRDNFCRRDLFLFQLGLSFVGSEGLVDALTFLQDTHTHSLGRQRVF